MSGGILKWLKGIFSKKKEIEREAVSFEELEGWVNRRTKERIDSIDADIKNKLHEIIREKDILQNKIEEFETAKLKNENIHIKEVQIMQGNRKSYINLVDIFLQNINPPADTGYEKLLEFCSKFEEQVSDFNKSSAKNYYILQEFFKHEVSEIAAHLRRIDSLVRELLVDDHKEIVSIKKDIAKLHQLIDARKQMEESIGKEAEDYKNFKMALDKNDLTLEKIKKSPDHLSLNRLNKEKESISHELKLEEDTIIQLFSPLDAAIKKYSKITIEHEGMLNSYLASPADAALADSGFKIVEVLQKMEKAVEGNEIELKDSKREKTLEKLKEINAEKLMNFVQRYRMLKESVSDVEKRIRLNSALTRLDEIHYMNSHLKEKMQRASENMDKIKKNIENLEIDDLKDCLEKQVKVSLGVELTIK